MFEAGVWGFIHPPLHPLLRQNKGYFKLTCNWLSSLVQGNFLRLFVFATPIVLLNTNHISRKITSFRLNIWQQWIIIFIVHQNKCFIRNFPFAAKKWMMKRHRSIIMGQASRENSIKNQKWRGCTWNKSCFSHSLTWFWGHLPSLLSLLFTLHQSLSLRICCFRLNSRIWDIYILVLCSFMCYIV